MSEYRRVLELAAQGKLPPNIDDSTDPSASVVRELLEAGYLWAIDATSFSGPAFLNARITLPGREYLATLQSQGTAPKPDTSTGWPRVDRALFEMRKRLADADSEEQFQAVGLLCREALISLAQGVYDPAKHPPVDGKTPSDTDAKRMFDAFIAVQLGGSSHEAARRYARAAFDLANDLQHRRTATYREASLCVEATSSAVAVVAIVSGHRDPP
jgi:hypothetical protein